MLAGKKHKNTAVRSEYELATGQFFKLLPFQILMLEVSSVNSLVDGAVASNMIGQDAMTAIGLFGPINHLLYVLSITLLSGSQILCGRYLGKNQKDELDNVFTVNQLFSFIISASSYKSDFTQASTSAISAVGSKRATTFPLLSTMNFVKFHLMSDFFAQSGSASESIFSITALYLCSQKPSNPF